MDVSARIMANKKNN